MSDSEIQRHADEARIRHLGQDHILRFNIENLIESLGIDVQAVTGLKKDFGIDAMPIIADKLILIDEDAYNDESIWYGRLRFTFGHELAHFELHEECLMQIMLRDTADWADFILKPEFSKSLEYQASEFAGRFLVPRDRLKLLIGQEKQKLLEIHGKELTNSALQKYMPVRLGRLFNVTPSVIEMRFKREDFWPLVRI